MSKKEYEYLLAIYKDDSLVIDHIRKLKSTLNAPAIAKDFDELALMEIKKLRKKTKELQDDISRLRRMLKEGKRTIKYLTKTDGSDILIKE